MDHRIPRSGLEPARNGQRALSQLTLVTGPGSGQRFNVEGGVVIGRSPDTQIVIDHEDVSRAHARLWQGPKDTYYLEDLGSRNGTFVDDIRIERCALSYGNRIRIGSEVVFEFSASLGLSGQLAQKHRFEMLGRLGVGAAHDVHNLLTAVSSSAATLKDLLVERGVSDRDLLECASDLELASSRAGKFAATMMDLARGGRSERAIVDLSELVGDALQMLLWNVSPGTQVQDRRAPDVLVLGNRSDLIQIFLNLGWNALDAMPGGGTLTVETRVLDRAPADVHFNSVQRVAVLSVMDSGVGMDEETTKRIFDPFFTTKDQGQGYGIGLTNVQDLVALCGGQVRFSTTPEQGSRFDVYLPALNASALRLANTVERPAFRARSSRTVLLVDADGVIRRTLGRLLRGSGFEVTESSTGDQALERLEHDLVDLVVVDAKARGVDGVQMHHRFVEARPNIRTVFAFSGAGFEAILAAAPRDDLTLLRKPFTFQQLLAAIDRLLTPG